jgi:hypothetical protein
MKSRLLIAATVTAALVAVLFAQSRSRAVSLVITNGLVVTMNPGRAIVENGAWRLTGSISWPSARRRT